MAQCKVCGFYTSTEDELVVHSCGEWPQPLKTAVPAQQTTNMPRDEIRLLAESVVSCLESGNVDAAKVIAENIVAVLSPVG